MESARAWLSSRVTPQWVIHSLRSTIAAVGSLLVARLLRLPEAYWAVLTTIVVMQSTLGAALKPSWQRFVGDALGAVSGALVATYFGTSTIVFTIGIFVLGLVCALLGLDRSAYRFAGLTLTIVLLITRQETPWMVAFHRFAEVSVGILVGLVVSALWPERDMEAAAKSS